MESKLKKPVVSDDGGAGQRWPVSTAVTLAPGTIAPAWIFNKAADRAGDLRMQRQRRTRNHREDNTARRGTTTLDIPHPSVPQPLGGSYHPALELDKPGMPSNKIQREGGLTCRDAGISW